MARSLSFLFIHSTPRLLNITARLWPLYLPEVIARVHAAIATSPDDFAQVCPSSAAAGADPSNTSNVTPPNTRTSHFFMAASHPLWAKVYLKPFVVLKSEPRSNVRIGSDSEVAACPHWACLTPISS